MTEQILYIADLFYGKPTIIEAVLLKENAVQYLFGKRTTLVGTGTIPSTLSKPSPSVFSSFDKALDHVIARTIQHLNDVIAIEREVNEDLFNIQYMKYILEEALATTDEPRRDIIIEQYQQAADWMLRNPITDRTSPWKDITGWNKPKPQNLPPMPTFHVENLDQ